MAETLSADAKQLIDSPNFAHFATLMPDAPRSPCGMDGVKAIISSSARRELAQGKNTRRDPGLRCRSSTSPIPTRKFRFAAGSRAPPDPELKPWTHLAQIYGKPFPMRNPEGRML